MPSVNHSHSLPLPNIAPKNGFSTAASGGMQWKLDTPKLKMPSRVRLPPRSKTGCWTCRARKVKCDEGHPKCGQCTRLGHVCDYNPRLSFRDDTLKTVERMHDVSIIGNAVWDSNTSTPAPSSPSSSTGEDSLPPFASLTNDIEREMKAECYTPGTYHVVVNPNSFANSPSYAEDTDEDVSLASSGDIKKSMSQIGHSSTLGSRESSKVDDPNVVILAKFEESWALTSNNWKTIHSQSSPPTSTPRSKSPEEFSNSKSQDSNKLRYPILLQSVGRVEDARLLFHFRKVVWTHLVQAGSGDESIATSSSSNTFSGAEIFEGEATRFRPLFHAMMAVSALSLTRQDHAKSIDSLQHYQQTLPFLQTSMRSHQDLSSDGVFLTHFLLLIYEIAAAEPGGSNLWSHHMERLLQICYMRRTILQKEPFPFVIWWICNIDMYALFSGAGTGEFARALMASNMIPGPKFQLYPVGSDGNSIIYPGEESTLPVMLQLSHDIFIQAVNLGLLASEYRRDITPQEFSDGSLGYCTSIVNPDMGKRLQEIRRRLIRIWNSAHVTLFEQRINQLPRRPKEIFQQCTTLLHSCLIYSYTSMWPNQLVESGGTSAPEIQQHVSPILTIASDIINAERFDLRFIVFPIFMAGVTSSSPTQKMIALDLLSRLEGHEAVGRNLSATRHVLQTVYRQQTNGYMRCGHALHVNWTEIMRGLGLQMVNFGL
ncbi:hypothetical protein FQN57_007130 [Myotisia sp. PD_48]|nr:hypothetical protein FQN57_007130 [Myotisia sp. PD_48]